MCGKRHHPSHLHFNVRKTDFIDEDGSFLSVGVLDTLFHHIGRKFVLGQGENLACHRRHDLAFVILKRKVLQTLPCHFHFRNLCVPAWSNLTGKKGQK